MLMIGSSDNTASSRHVGTWTKSAFTSSLPVQIVGAWRLGFVTGLTRALLAGVVVIVGGHSWRFSLSSIVGMRIQALSREPGIWSTDDGRKHPAGIPINDIKNPSAACHRTVERTALRILQFNTFGLRQRNVSRWRVQPGKHPSKLLNRGSLGLVRG